MNKYYYDEENNKLYKWQSSCHIFVCIPQNAWWEPVSHDFTIAGLKEISEEEADDIVKRIVGGEYDLWDGYILNDFSGEV